MARILDAVEIDRRLRKNAHKFIQPGWFFLENSNLGKREDFDAAHLRILILFMSQGETRAVSSTDLALVSIIKQTLPGNQSFVDTCFLPLKENAELLDKLELPWAFGGLSHHPMHDYDVVFVSNSIIEEKYNLFPILANSDFPLWSTQRDRMSNLPYLLLGGAGASEAEPLYGKSMDGKDECLIDSTYVGYAEPHLSDLLKTLVKMKDAPAGNLLRMDHQEVTRALYKFPCIYNPRAYEQVFDKDNWTIKEIKKCDLLAPDRVQFAQQTENSLNTAAGFENKIIYNHGNFDANDVQISAGCSGGRVCSFCHEGHSQAWREKKLEKILAEATAARNASFASTFSAYSFNSNFHPRYEDIMFEVASRYPKITVIGMRLDGIAHRPDYLKMDKYLGLQKLTVGVEGVSGRIRNGYLNKSLTEEDLVKGMRSIFAARFMQTKMYFILTGREENADWDECVAMLTKLHKIRDEMGSNTSFRLTFSMLCHYPHTQIAWDERRTVKHALLGGRINYFIEKVKDLGVAVRFTSRGKSIAFQQLNIDVGRPLTAIFENLWKTTKMVWYRNIGDDNVDLIFSMMKQEGMPNSDKIFDERPYTWIFPSQVIRIKSDEWLIEASKLGRQFKGKDYCLTTQAKPNKRGCDSCGLCLSAAEKKRTANHTTHTAEHTVDDVLVALSQNKPRYRYRFVFNAPKEYAFLHKRPLAHYYMTQAVPEDFKPNVWGVAADSDPTRDTVHPHFQYQFSGQFFFDLETRIPLPLEILKVPKDSILTLTGVYPVPLNYDVKYTDWQISMVETVLSDSLMDKLRDEDRVKSFPWIEDDLPLVWGHERVEFWPMLRKGATLQLMLVHPLRSNLIKWISDLTGQGYQNVINNTLLGILHHIYVRQSQGLRCKLCAKDAVINLSNAKETGFCLECLRKLLYKKTLGA